MVATLIIFLVICPYLFQTRMILNDSLYHHRLRRQYYHTVIHLWYCNSASMPTLQVIQSQSILFSEFMESRKQHYNGAIHSHMVPWTYLESYSRTCEVLS